MNQREGTRGCFKMGCFGCLALVGVGLGLIFLMSAIQMSSSSSEPTFEAKSSEQILPPLPAPPVPPAPPAAGAPPELEAGPEAAASGLSLEPNEVQQVEMPNQGAPLGTIEVDFSMGDFTIRPGPANEPIRIEADYDTSRFELKKELIQKPDGTWTYKVEFDAKGGFFGLFGVDGGQNRVELVIPRGRPINVKGKIGMGESKTDLGGLWIKNLDLEYKMGDHFIEFREPLPFPMDDFKVHGSMGGLEIRGLGQASPSNVDVQQSMGETFLDLQGDWRNDAMIRARFSMGECKVWLPEKARIDLRRASVSLGEASSDRNQGEIPPEWPTLTIDASGSMGELRIER